MKGIPVDLVDAVFGVPPLVHVRKPFLNGLPTGDCWPPWLNKNRVARVKRGTSGGIVVVVCFINPLNDCEDLLGCLWIRHIFLLGVNRQSKADCQSYEGNY